MLFVFYFSLIFHLHSTVSIHFNPDTTFIDLCDLYDQRIIYDKFLLFMMMIKELLITMRL